MNKTTIYCLLTFASLIIIGSYFYLAIPDCIQNRAVCFQATDLAPYKYRILQPALERLIAPGGSQDSTLWVDFILQALLTPVIIVGLWQWLKRWSDDTRALVGVLLFAILNIAAYRFYMRGISTAIEIACVVGLLWNDERSFFTDWLIIIVASLNRETGLFLVMIWMAYHSLRWHSWRKEYLYECATLLITSAFVLGVIHVVFGYSDHVLGLVGTLEYNWQNIGDSIFTNILLLPMFIAVIVAYKSSPTALKRLLWVAGLYVLAVLVGGAWNETMRLLLPVLPIVLAAVMYKPVEVVERMRNLITFPVDANDRPIMTGFKTGMYKRGN